MTQKKHTVSDFQNHFPLIVENVNILFADLLKRNLVTKQEINKDSIEIDVIKNQILVIRLTNTEGKKHTILAMDDFDHYLSQPDYVTISGNVVYKDHTMSPKLIEEIKKFINGFDLNKHALKNYVLSRKNDPNG